MDYKDYQYSRDAAWRILIDCHITELPVRALDICKALDITVRRTTLTAGPEGRSVALNGRPVILLAAGPAPERRRFTLAHELGHIMLGHMGLVGLVNREPSPEDDPLEQAANVFASRLLAPACVLWGCGVQSAGEIAQMCGISQAAAQFRWERLQILYRRNKFLLSPLERQLYAQFRPYIEAHRRK